MLWRHPVYVNSKEGDVRRSGNCLSFSRRDSARISNSSKHEVVKLLFDKANQLDDIWIGLVDIQKIRRNNTERFTFVDGAEEGRDFFAAAEEFPWAKGQPDDDDPGQPCVA